MATIEIPFREEFEQAILDGRKVCTARTKKYGKPGDKFQVRGQTFVITEIYQIPLIEVARLYFRQEGCHSPEEFKEIWEELHPHKGFIPHWLVQHHWWKRKEASDE